MPCPQTVNFCDHLNPVIRKTSLSPANPHRVFDFFPLEERILLSGDSLDSLDLSTDPDVALLDALMGKMLDAGQPESTIQDADSAIPISPENESFETAATQGDT